MAVLPMIAARKSQDTISVVHDSQLSYYPITDWDIRVIIILWVLFFITSIFVVLRFYSRIRILQFYALEDHLYNVAFTLLLAYNAIITFYSYHGLGSQLLDVMTTADVRLAVVFENVLFDLGAVGLLVAKASLISFLMRLVPQHHSPWRWRLLVIGPLVALAVVSLGAMLAYWARCFAELAGRALLCTSIVPAMRWMQAAAGVSVAVDLWYAALPWYLLRRLSRPRREKVLIQGSMSLGVIAAGCGIARALSIAPAANNSDPESAAILYLWHGAEMAVTMICIGMPVCRPAVSSVLHAVGLTSGGPAGHTGRATHGSSRSGAAARRIRNAYYHHRHGRDGDGDINLKSAGSQTSGTGGGPSCIRNFSSGTWEDAVGAHDVDSWSQRRILGVGEATSGVVAGAGAGVVVVGSRGGGGGGSNGSSFSKEGKLGGVEIDYDGSAAATDDITVAGGGDDNNNNNNSDVVLGFPMRTMSKAGGITVTRTVDITNGRKNSRSGRRP